MIDRLKRVLQSESISALALVIRFVVTFGLMALCFFGSAGTLYWPEAWACIVLQLTISLTMTFWLQQHDPELLKSRTSYFKPGLHGSDKLFAGLFMVGFIPYLILPGLDAMRFGWSDVPFPVQLAGFAGYVWSMWLIFRVMQVNSFASPVVEVQKKRHHSVIDTGPYARVRHPMYSGFIGSLLFLPLALGSWWGLLPGLLIALNFLIRISFEEQTLCAELEGYAEYCERVRFRLLPGVW
ncbi:MAG: methyltransferase family protein [Mariprofundus sp.]